MHLHNPDHVLNSHGKNICKFYIYDIINGLNAKYDSEFTCFGGKKRSQNDICITNDPSLIKRFEIMDRLLISDHSPCIAMLNIIPSTPLYFLENCSKSFLNDDQYDISNRLKSTVKFTNVDYIKIIQKFNAIASEIDTLFDDTNLNNSQLAQISEDKIYNACRDNGNVKITADIVIDNDINDKNSPHLMAIADMNYYMFDYL